VSVVVVGAVGMSFIVVEERLLKQRGEVKQYKP